MDYWAYKDYLMHYGVPGMKWGVRKDRDVIKEHFAKAREQGRINSMDKNLIRSRVKAENRGNRIINKARYLQEQDGKDPRKAIAKGEEWLKSANTIKRMQRKYSELSDGKRTALNVANHVSGLLGGAIGSILFSVSASSYLRKP